jgi:hypothetical protein
MRKTATIMEEPSDGFHEEQRLGRRYDKRSTSLAFGNGWTVLGCIGPNKNIIIIIIIIHLENEEREDLETRGCKRLQQE